MSKFNKTRVQTRNTASAPVQTQHSVPDTRTFEGAPAYSLDAKGALFTLAVVNMVGENNSFYESAGDRDARYESLIRQVASEDPEWLKGFFGWLRRDAFMRSASTVGVLVAAKVMVESKITGSRQMVASALARADEPGEALAYWLSTYGKKIPKPVKRGIADAAAALYNEYSSMKYDSSSNAVRFGDVLDLTHPVPKDNVQDALFKYLLDSRHNREGLEVPEALSMIQARKAIRVETQDRPEVLLDFERLAAAGMTWEDALSQAGKRVDKAQLWEAIVKSGKLGYMAALRNLRNMDEAGVSDEVAEIVARKISDPAEVAKSMQFPYRFLNAYRNAPSTRWAHALTKALDLSLSNLPAFKGRTLVLVDHSGSMAGSRVGGEKSTLSSMYAAALFGVALTLKGEAVDLYGFSDHADRWTVRKGGSVLPEVDRLTKKLVAHGTETALALQQSYGKHDRVLIFTDMQTFGDGVRNSYYGRPAVGNTVPENVPIYAFDLGGHGRANFALGEYRHQLASLNDSSFRMIPLLEKGSSSGWPWM